MILFLENETPKDDQGSICPAEYPFVYDYEFVEDGCCDTEIDENGFCTKNGGLVILCEKPPCVSHPSVAEEKPGAHV